MLQRSPGVGGAVSAQPERIRLASLGGARVVHDPDPRPRWPAIRRSPRTAAAFGRLCAASTTRSTIAACSRTPPGGLPVSHQLAGSMLGPDLRVDRHTPDRRQRRRGAWRDRRLPAVSLARRLVVFRVGPAADHAILSLADGALPAGGGADRRVPHVTRLRPALWSKRIGCRSSTATRLKWIYRIDPLRIVTYRGAAEPGYQAQPEPQGRCTAGPAPRPSFAMASVGSALSTCGSGPEQRAFYEHAFVEMNRGFRVTRMSAPWSFETAHCGVLRRPLPFRPRCDPELWRDGSQCATDADRTLAAGTAPAFRSRRTRRHRALADAPAPAPLR